MPIIKPMKDSIVIRTRPVETRIVTQVASHRETICVSFRHGLSSGQQDVQPSISQNSSRANLRFC